MKCERLIETYLATTRQVEINAGDVVKLTTNPEFRDTGNASCVYIDYLNLPRVLRPGRYASITVFVRMADLLVNVLR